MIYVRLWQFRSCVVNTSSRTSSQWNQNLCSVWTGPVSTWSPAAGSRQRISCLWFTDLFLKSEAWRVWTRWLLRGKLILDGNVVNLRRRKWLISKREVKQKSSFHTLPVSGWSTWVWFKSEQRDEFHHRVSGLKVTSYFTDYVPDQSQRSTCRSIYTHSLLVLNTSGWPK